MASPPRRLGDGQFEENGRAWRAMTAGRASGYRTTGAPPRTSDVRPDDSPLIKVLEAHVETLKEQLAAAEVRAEKLAADFAERDAERAVDLATERTRTEKAIAAAEARAAQEAEKTEKAIAAFSALAERLNALAAERARPWWRKLVG